MALSNRFNGFSTFHLSFLLLLSSAGIFVDELPRDVVVNDSNLFNNSIINVKFSVLINKLRLFSSSFKYLKFIDIRLR